jgi:exodeoxyribonuclease V beta subunit
MRPMAEVSTSPILDLLSEPIGTKHAVNLAIEASAGTGKTYSLTALYARLVAENDNATLDHILVVTFTRNAAAALRSRIREQIKQVIDEMWKPTPDSGEFPNQLRRHLVGIADDARRRLEAALASFDSANIMTIDSFCAQILRLGGMVVQPEGAGKQHSDRVNRAVNDEAVSAASGQSAELIDETRYQTVVKAQLRRPMAEPRFETPHPAPAGSGHARILDRLSRLESVVKKSSVDSSVDYDEVKRRAVELVAAGGPVLDSLARQYRYIFIDEAQDTDGKQWELFDLLWSEVQSQARRDGEGAARVFVGDPKQSIYGFRGADVAAFVRQVDQAKTAGTYRVLNTNYRSDKPVLDVLNVLLDGSSYGPSTGYETVIAGALGRHSTDNRGAATAVSLIECDSMCLDPEKGEVTYRTGLVVEPAAARVVDLLTSAIGVVDRGCPTTFTKSDIAVLTRTGANARAIQRQLVKWNVPAVSNSTSTVAESDAFVAWRSLAMALDRPSDEGRVRRVLMSTLFGMRGYDPELQKADFVAQHQELMEKWRGILLEDGVVALALAVFATPSVNRAFLSGPSLLRRLTDFNHLVEMTSEAARGRGMSPRALIEALDDVAARESTDEVAARRVESDDDAVQVMTVHAAKGLQFPVVVVADMWTLGNKPAGPRVVAVDPVDVPPPSDTKSRQWLEAAYANDSREKEGKGPVFDREKRDRRFDKKRLFYVAVTRAKHSLSVLTTQRMGLDTEGNATGHDAKGKAKQPIPCMNLDGAALLPLEAAGVLQRLDGKRLKDSVQALPAESTEQLVLRVAQSHRPVVQTSDRVSYSDLVGRIKGDYDGHRRSVFEELIRQQDEIGDPPAEADVGGAVDMPLWDLPAGGHVGDVFHKVFEHLDVSADDFDAELHRVIERYAFQDFMQPHRERLFAGLKQVCATPLGPELNNMTLRDVDPRLRVAEMRFDAAVSVRMPGDAASVGHIGEYLLERLGPDDPLRGYGGELKSSGGRELIRGTLNGSIDKIIPVGSGDTIRFYVSDYKSNKVTTPQGAPPIDRYLPSNLREVMQDAHYPLQALLYGVALHRYLRWRAPQLDADAAVGGWSYLFLRGMLGESAKEAEGSVHGVSTWSSRKYPRFWSGLSDVLMGDRR